jgi:hypothetical protein
MPQYKTIRKSVQGETNSSMRTDGRTDGRRDGWRGGQIDTNAHDKANSRVLQHYECAYTDTKTFHLHSFLILALLYSFIRKCNHMHKYECTNTRVGHKISIYGVGPIIWQLQNLGTPCMQPWPGTKQMLPFPALKKNRGGHKCSEGREADTVVTQRLVTQDTRTVWKSRGIGLQLSLW